MKDNNYLNLSIVKITLNEVEKLALEEGIPVVIALCNNWGNTIGVHFMDDALPASFDIAINKAYTSSTIRMATKSLKELAKDGGELFSITNNNKIIAFPGGFPIEVDGKIYGAIGVSGGSADYDNKLALFGKRVCEEVIEWSIKKQF